MTIWDFLSATEGNFGNVFAKGADNQAEIQQANIVYHKMGRGYGNLEKQTKLLRKFKPLKELQSDDVKEALHLIEPIKIGFEIAGGVTESLMDVGQSFDSKFTKVKVKPAQPKKPPPPKTTDVGGSKAYTPIAVVGPATPVSSRPVIVSK